MARKTKPTPPVAPQPVMEIITPQQVAERLQIESATVYELTRSRCTNPLPAHRVGKLLRFDWAEVQQWFNERAKGAA